MAKSKKTARPEAAAQTAEKEKKNYRLILGTVLRLAFKADKFYLPLMFLHSLIMAARDLLLVFFPKFLIERINAGRPWEQIVPELILYAAFMYLVHCLGRAAENARRVRMQRTGKLIVRFFSDKTMRLEYANLEDPDVLDLKESASFSILYMSSVEQVMQHMANILNAVLKFGSLLLVLLHFSLLMTLAVLLFNILGALFVQKQQARMRDRTQETIPWNRRFGYYMDVLMTPVHQQEFRFYDSGDLVLDKISFFNRKIYEWLRDIESLEARANSVRLFFATFSRFLIYAYTVLRTFSTLFGHSISIADLSLYISAGEQFMQSFRSLSESLVSLFIALDNAAPIYRYLHLPEIDTTDGEEAVEDFVSLRFENVSFRYPGTERDVLKDISFTIKKGEVISIVGLNNAGKTTIVKLICRFFEPTKGRILLNDKDIRTFRYDSYIKRISCVFQDFKLLPLTLEENITINASPNQSRLEQIIRELDLRALVDSLPQGLKTYYDRNIYPDGTELSGGQQQKIAIARSLFKEGDLVILDEPTAALDPLAESEVYENFHRITHGSTAIYISHRMSSSRFCDKILLLDDGRIAAFDSHDQLMQSHNLYRRLFRAQAQYYKEGQ